MRLQNKMTFARLQQWLSLLVCLIILLKVDVASVPITILEDAVAKGAVCLDGSPPAYYFEKGSKCGVDNWLIHIEGGGWCESVEECLVLTKQEAGSSKVMVKEYGFSGILDNRKAFNPDFFNWNHVKIRYCDGGSLTGDVENVDPANKLYFRGHRIFEFIMADLLEKGMKSAKRAILTGCSAGGLASILNCDKFRDLLPASAKVKCVSDGGFFIHAKDITGEQTIEKYYGNVAKLHGSVKNLPASCTSKMGERPELCFFPQYVAKTMKTPIFLVNTPYDTWQINNILVGPGDKNATWCGCRLDITKCTPDQLKIIEDFRGQFLCSLNSSGIVNSKDHGMFIDSCFAHCQTSMPCQWYNDISTVVADTKMAKAVGDWFYERNPVKIIDCPYPCNPTCPKIDDNKVNPKA